MIKGNWYLDAPKMGDILSFRVKDTTDVGYNVELCAYKSQYFGFLPFSELSLKKIKKNPASFLKEGSRHCGVVTDADGYIVHLSIKHVTPEQKAEEEKMYADTEHLFSICQRLSYLEESKNADLTEDAWFNVFAKALSQYRTGNSYDEDDSDEDTDEDADDDTPDDTVEDAATHPLNILSRRDMVNRSGVLPKQYMRIIRNNHAALFGFKPVVCTVIVTIVTFDMNGTELVKTVLNRIMEHHGGSGGSDKELYDDQTKYNLHINPVALPEFHLEISAYLKDVCQRVADSAIAELNAVKFDIFNVKEITFR